MEIIELYAIFLQHSNIKTDSRKVLSQDLFFALKGPNYNGNTYAQQALDAGAAYAVIDEAIDLTDSRLIYTADVLQTLQLLARHHRQQFTIPFIAITGSNGKTTTKELIREVLATTYKTYSTIGNLNNHIGVPLTILSIKKDAEMAIIEMGANHLKEIEGYCSYTLPTHGIITNAGKAHLEGFGGVEGVKKGKGELYDFLKNNHGVIFRMNDYAYLKKMSEGIATIVTYGTGDADITGKAAIDSDFLEVAITSGSTIKTIKTQLVGSYNLPNVLAAITVGKYFKVPEDKIKIALEGYSPDNSRSQMIEKNGNKFILDAYNANPSSMRAAIENFAQMPGNNKIIWLGGMMELGAESVAEHQALVDLLAKFIWKEVVLIGGDFINTKHAFKYLNNAAEGRSWFKKQQYQDGLLLIKGSRSIQMEKILEP